MMPALNTGVPVKAIQERPIMTHFNRTNDLIHTTKATLSRTHYKLMWGRMRDSDSFGASSPAICCITKELPALVCGSDRSQSHAHDRKSPARKERTVTAKGQSSKITSSSGCTTSSGDGSGQGDDDDGGGGDSDPDGPNAIATTSFSRQNIQFETTTSMSTAGLLRLPQVLNIFPVSKSTWWAGVKTGRYPAPVKPSRRTTAWRHSDILELIESLADGTSARASQEVLQ
jgi:prophage regulatory protein